MGQVRLFQLETLDIPANNLIRYLSVRKIQKECDALIPGKLLAAAMVTSRFHFLPDAWFGKIGWRLPACMVWLARCQGL